MNPTEIRILRLAVGTTIAMAMAQSIAWPMAFITPVFTAMFLASPTPCPTRPAVVFLAISMLATSATGLFLTLFLLPYLLAYVVGLILIYLLIFYWAFSGANPFLIVMILVGVTAIPVLGQLTPNLALGFSIGFSISALAAIALVLLAHGLVPDQPAPPTTGTAAAQKALPSEEQRLEMAFMSTLVVAPAALFFLHFQLASELVTLIFIVTMSFQPNVKAGLAASKKNLTGAFAGGLIATVWYELLVMVPSFTFLILLTFAFMLWVGAGIYSGRSNAAVYAASLSTVLIVLGGAVGSEEAEAATKFYIRVLQIFVAGLYVVGVFSLLEGAIERRRSRAPMLPTESRS